MSKCLYKKEIQYVSYDLGNSWQVTGESRKGSLIAQGSSLCTEAYKFQATYAGGTTYSAACNVNTTLESGDTKPSGYDYFSMTSAIVGECVTSIGFAAFENCSGLTSVVIPNSVTSIGGWAFSFCESLTSITIPNSVTTIGNSAFKSCDAITTVTIPDSVTSVDSFAFEYCPSLTSATIGSSVSDLKTHMFGHCDSLSSVTVNATTPPTLNVEAFHDTPIEYGSGTIYVPCASLAAYRSATNWNTFASQIHGIPPCSEPTPTFDGKWLASYTGGTTSSAECDSSSAITENEITLTDLTDVEIGSCVASIGYAAFFECTSLTSVNIPDSVTSIGDYAFYKCASLTSIDIPNSVISIGIYAFLQCSSLTSIIIPDSVTSIGNGAFSYCSGLTSCTIGSGVTSIDGSAFYGCSGLTSIIIPDSVTSIGGSAFRNCSGLTSVTCLATTPPSLSSKAFDNTNNCPIYVPAASVSAYQSAWSTYASRIQALP